MAKKQDGSDSDTIALKVLQNALSEAQTSVRSYDTKAQIVGVGYAFALGIVAGTSDWFPKSDDGQLLPILIFWGVVMAPLILFGFVLHPTRKTAPKLEVKKDDKLKNVLFVDPTKHTSPEDLKKAVLGCNPLTEFAYETLKVSKLRELKRTRFIRALIVAAIAFATLFIGHLLGAFR